MGPLRSSGGQEAEGLESRAQGPALPTRAEEDGQRRTVSRRVVGRGLVTSGGRATGLRGPKAGNPHPSPGVGTGSQI